MKLIKTDIEGVVIIEPHLFEDERGYFYESFNSERFETLTGINVVATIAKNANDIMLLEGLFKD
jgi:dTDP-4-dehydrorhamnose 3,5-epimerase-like enzyme